MNVAAYLVKILEEEGLENIFGLPGEQILPFYKTLKDSKINHILVRHEQAAMHAADAYYKSSHKLSACVATQRADTSITQGSCSPAILYILGIISKRPCDAVNVVVRAPAEREP